ncbi:MAG: hypothetical protein A4E71_02956 [Smithella sp. PtaU1.Bin162]|nr:MAG: hypothetical protein A4E71_02956 [Smithella sp. PtaU1.Bin162]
MRLIHRLSAATVKTYPPCFIHIGDGRCTGCSTCANSCYKTAIEIKLNEEGFYRPTLLEGRCDHCMLCLKSCPVLVASGLRDVNGKPAGTFQIYAAWSTDQEVHYSSSSGGIFSELARFVIDNSGYVCGCEWGDGLRPRHTIIRKWTDVPKLRGSKYIPSYIGNDLFRNIIALAMTGKTILFCGTPCQVAGLAQLASPEARKNLILVDLICHGVPSLTSFWLYLDWKFGGKAFLTHFSFRNKEISVQTICARTKNGLKYLNTCGQDPWFRAAMVYHLFLQRSCYKCCFGSSLRYGDISLGDFWGIPAQWHNPRGDSLVIANTKKGQGILQNLILTKRIHAQSSDLETASRKIGRLKGVAYPVPANRNLSFWLLKRGWSFCWFHYLCYYPISFRKRLAGYLYRRVIRIVHILRLNQRQSRYL